MRSCNRSYVTTLHRDYEELDGYGFSTDISEFYSLSEFPVGVANKLKKMGVPSSVLKIIKDNKKLEVSYFYGQVYSEGDSYSWTEPTTARCFSVRDNKFAEVLYSCR